VVESVGIVVAEQLGQAVVPGGEGLVFRLVGRVGQPVGDLDHFLLGPEQLAERRLGLVEQGTASLERLILFEQEGAGARVQADVAGVRGVLAGQDAHERRLAGAVRADEPDALAVVKLEGQVVEQRPAVEGPRQVRTAQQKHRTSLGFTPRD
jgi:hypothetical protein